MPGYMLEFLSTLSLRRATEPVQGHVFLLAISIHALLAESDGEASLSSSGTFYFYPRSPCGERPGNSASAAATSEFLSTLSLRRATAKFFGFFLGIIISIHALLAESDCIWIPPTRPRSPFLSTLSLRRATSRSQRSKSWQYYFYPRSPCGERRPNRQRLAQAFHFYPRSPCGERPMPPIPAYPR